MKATDVLEKLKIRAEKDSQVTSEAASEKMEDMISDLKMLVDDLKKKDNNAAAIELEKLMQRYMEPTDLKDQKM